MPRGVALGLGARRLTGGPIMFAARAPCHWGTPGRWRSKFLGMSIWRTAYSCRQTIPMSQTMKHPRCPLFEPACRLTLGWMFGVFITLGLGGCGGGGCCGGKNSGGQASISQPAQLNPQPAQNAGAPVGPGPALAQNPYGGQRNCPVTGEALGSMGPPIPVNVQGQTVYVCCQGCSKRLLLGSRPRCETATPSGVSAETSSSSSSKARALITDPIVPRSGF